MALSLDRKTPPPSVPKKTLVPLVNNVIASKSVNPVFPTVHKLPLLLEENTPPRVPA